MKKLFFVLLLMLICVGGYFSYTYLFPEDVELEEENIFVNQKGETRDEVVNSAVDQKSNVSLEKTQNVSKVTNSEQNSTSVLDTKDNNESLSNDVEEDVENFPKLVFSGEFERIDYSIEGSYEIYALENGNYGLRVEDLDIINGPDLHFVLSNEWGESLDEYVKISGSDVDGERFVNKGSYNLEIASNTNLEEYDNLIIHCVQFNHAFAGARLQ